MNYENIFKTIDTNAYYHFLDGYLNPEGGSITNYNIIEKLLLNKSLNINDLTLFYTVEILSDFRINIEFMNRDKLYRDYIICDINKTDNYDDILNKCKFCIFSINSNNHAMSMIINMNLNNENYDTNILLINSGDGIKNHDTITNNDTEYYKPYYGFSFNDTKDNSIKKILILLSFFYLYNEIKDLIKDKKSISYPYFLRFNNILLNIYELFTIPPNISDLEVNIKNKNNSDFIINFKPLLNKINFDNLQNYLSHEYKYEFAIHTTFGNFLYNFMGVLREINKPYNFLIENISLDIQIIKQKIKEIIPESDVDENVILKNKLYVYNSEPYILPQLSGSCTWYSIYWALSLYIVLNKIDKYQEFNIFIYTEFAKPIKDLFSKIEFTLNDKLNYLYTLRNIQNKLINIKLLPKINEYYNILNKDIVLNESKIENNIRSISTVEEKPDILYIYKSLFSSNYNLYQIIQMLYNYIKNHNFIESKINTLIFKKTIKFF